MHNADNYIPAERFDFSSEQLDLMDTSHSLLEAMKNSGANAYEVALLRGVTFRRDGWGGNFYNGNGNQALTYNELVGKSAIPEILKVMKSQTDKLRQLKESALSTV